MNIPALNLIDWYKADHRRQYPKGTTLVFSNFTPRKSRIPERTHIRFFGLQYFIKEYLINRWNDTFFNKNLSTVLAAYERRINNGLGKDAITYEHIKALHKLGYLPIEVRALPEGSKVPFGVPPFVIFNTHPDFYWLPNYLETILSCTLWGMSNSATIAREYREIFDRYAILTTGSIEAAKFQGHDFSFRGMFGEQAATISDAAHLLSFYGSDTVPGIDFLEQYYGADSNKELFGLSVPATEHSVMCAGSMESELDTIVRIMELYPKGIVSIVSDTWDYWKVLTEYLPKLKDRILSREGKVVIRPDSSPKTPLEIICGDPEASDNTPERIGSIHILAKIFGTKLNFSGYWELNSHIGLIYGDSITLSLAENICKRLEEQTFASTNWVAGIGSYTYQYNTRDTQGWAMKATYCEINGEPREIFKNPKTDNGTKKSAKGLIAVMRDPKTHEYFIKEQATWDEVNSCWLERVFKDGELLRTETLAEIRKTMGTF